MRVVGLYVVVAVDLSSDLTGVRVHDGDNFASLFIDVIVTFRNPGMVFLMIVVIVVFVMIVSMIIYNVIIVIMVVISIMALNDMLDVTSVWVLDRDNFTSLACTVIVVI